MKIVVRERIEILVSEAEGQFVRKPWVKEVKSYEEGEKLIADCYEEDKYYGNYIPNLYEIAEI